MKYNTIIIFQYLLIISVMLLDSVNSLV
jgi:hypothetical protein